MQPDRAARLRDLYADALLHDVVPFWMRHSVDAECGGFFTQLARDGSLYGTDKPVWLQGRETWLFATLFTQIEPREDWLRLARHGADFLDRHCFAPGGKMYFCVTRDGRPLRMRRYVYSEVFAIIAFAALAKAENSPQRRRRAIEVFDSFVRHLRTPGLLPPKVDPATRPGKALSPLMCLLNVANTLIETAPPEACSGSPPDARSAPSRTGSSAADARSDTPGVDHVARFERLIDETIDEIFRDFVKPDRNAVLEAVRPDGGPIDGPDGRVMNPGHAIECAWFIMDVARRRGDSALLRRAAALVDVAFERGWDREHGGLLYFVDVDGHPATQLEHDMKLWWPHNEACIAALMAFRETGEPRYAEMFETLHAWTFDHFPDPEFGEWFGYLHRDGSVSTPIKGGMWKGAFHVPRGLLMCRTLLDGIAGA
ncbi:MAG: AGE family epimerase/isomerase [Phycisphaerales bacterium]|nr:AGE family epimerase/isomerase [Phycisphaerales bacterium]